jgi:hypothetical protein
MYGFSGYGTNAYGSQRQAMIRQIVRFGGRVFTGLYSVAQTFLRFNSTRTFQLPPQ